MVYARDDHEAEIWVPLAQIRISTRRRRGLSSATVERYREWLEQGRAAPPVRLARDGDGFVVRDGRHRVAAALVAGHAVVKAELRRIAGWFGWRQAPLALLHRRTLGTWLRWRSASLAPRRCGFDSRRLHFTPP